MIQVSDFGTDDTAVRAAISAAKANAASVVYFGPGVYTVDGSGEYARVPIVIDFPVTINIHPQAIIQQVPTPWDYYAVFDLTNSTGVTIMGGGAIRGDYADAGAGTSYGKGFGLVGTGISRLSLQDVTITNFRGDCIGFGQSSEAINQSIRIERCTISRSTRNGMSIGGAYRLLVQDCTFENNGLETMPRAHIDIEGHGGPTDTAAYLWFSRNSFGYAPEQDLVLSSSLDTVRVTNNTFTPARRAVNISANCLTARDVVLADNKVQGDGNTLMGFSISAGKSSGVVIQDNVFSDILRVETTYGSAIFFGTGESLAPRITGNTFDNCYNSIREYAYDSVAPIDAEIGNNVFINTPPSKI